jgi:acetylglutamate kinase
MTNNDKNRDLVVAALRHAAPYIRMYKRKTFIIKAGGELFLDQARTRSMLEQMAILHQVGIRLVLVHGAGPQSTQRTKELGLQPRMVEGRRVTDADTLNVCEQVNNEVRQLINATCEELGMPTKGLVGAEGPVRAHQRPPVEMEGEGLVDFGFVGDIDAIDTDMVQTYLDAGTVPVISPLGSDADGTLLNINADTIAASLAAGLHAEKLVLATGALGIFEDLNDKGSLVSYTDLAGLNQLRKNGSLADGMLPKAKAIEQAVEGGVPRVHVISYAVQDGLLLEIFTNEGTGTLVVKSIEALTAEEQSAGNTE